MDNQYRHIQGYRELSQTEIDLMNKIKAIGPELESLIGAIQDHLNSEFGHLFESDQPLEPYHWLSEGKTNLQLGLMCLTRAVAQPTAF